MASFDSQKACNDKANNHCFDRFMDCEDYRKYYADPSTWGDWTVPERRTNHRTCNYCCNNSGYTGLPKNHDGTKWCFCQIRRESVERNRSPCEWFNRHPGWGLSDLKEGDAMGLENLKKGILTGLGKMENIEKEANAASESTALNIIESNGIVVFDYSMVDDETAEFLIQKANNVIFINAGMRYAIGKELKEVQDKLAKNKTGIFQAWCRSLGFSEDTAYNYIHVYEFITEQFGDIGSAKNFLALPQKLQYAVSKPSAPAELQKAVIDGDITTHKQYKELEAKLKAIEDEVEMKQRLYETISKSYDRLEKTNHAHYERTKKLEGELEKTKEQLLKAQAVGDSEGVEKVKQQLQNTESELEDAQKKIELLESELGDDTEIATAVVGVSDDVLEEMETSAEIKVLLKALNSNVLSLGQLLSLPAIKNRNHNIAIECKPYIEQIRSNMLLLKKIAFEGLNRDIFDFIKD